VHVVLLGIALSTSRCPVSGDSSGSATGSWPISRNLFDLFDHGIQINSRPPSYEDRLAIYLASSHTGSLLFHGISEQPTALYLSVDISEVLIYRLPATVLQTRIHFQGAEFAPTRNGMPALNQLFSNRLAHLPVEILERRHLWLEAQQVFSAINRVNFLQAQWLNLLCFIRVH
jgi:hypothetical protein